MSRTVSKSIVNSVLALSVSLVALAGVARADVQIDSQADEWIKVSSLKFEVNTVLKRAWVMVDYLDENCASAVDSCSQHFQARLQVPGLAYDPATSTVTYSEQGGSPVVCAYVKHHSFLERWTTVKDTGLCAVHTDVKPAVNDQGQTIEGMSQLNVLFGIRNN